MGTWIREHAKPVKIAAMIFAAVILIAAVISLIFVLTDKFKVSVVEKIELGDSVERVESVLGQPDVAPENQSVWQYASGKAGRLIKNYAELGEKLKASTDAEEIKKISAERKNIEKKIKDGDYKCVEIVFDGDGKVSGVTLDARYEITPTPKKRETEKIRLVSFDLDTLVAAVYYADGSYRYNSYDVTQIVHDGSACAYVELLGKSGDVELHFADDWGSYTVTIALSEIMTPTTENGIRYLGTASKPYLYLDEVVDKSLTSVTVKEGVSRINENAFGGCTITSATMPVWAMGSVPKENLQTAVITSGTVLKFKGFSGYTALTDVTLPDGLTELAAFAFSGCTALKGIAHPDSVSVIGASAFSGCTALESVALPENVKIIGSGAFKDCTALKEITMPGAATNVVENVFEGSPVIKATVHASLIPALPGETLQTVVITGGTRIEKSAFEGYTALKSVTLSESVSAISERAFYGCSSLTDLTVKGSPSLQSQIFDGCPIRNASVSRGVALNISKEKLERLVVTSGEMQGEFTYNGRGDMTDAVIYDGTPEIKQTDFRSGGALKSITIPASVVKIELGSFIGCDVLGKVYYQGTVAEWCNINFENSYSNPLTYGADLYIGGEKLTALTVPEEITEIKPYTFINCDSLMSVRMGSGVESIGRYAFSSCDLLISVTIGSGVETIEEEAFFGCYKLIEVYDLSPALEINNDDENGQIGLYAKAIYTSADEPTEIATDESGFTTYIEDGKKVLGAYVGREAVVSIPEGVEVIGPRAFARNKTVTRVTLPESVTTIELQAFYDCTSLITVIISSGVTGIGDDAFFGCHKLIEVYDLSPALEIARNEGNGRVGYFAEFIHTSADEPSHLSVDSNGFVTYESGGETVLGAYIGTASEITLPASIRTVRRLAFDGSNTVNAVYYQGALEDWLNMNFEGPYANPLQVGAYLYVNGEKLTSLVLPVTVTEIKSNVFAGIKGLRRVYYQGSLADWCNIKFGNEYANPLSNLSAVLYINGEFVRDLNIPSGVTEIKDYAFYGYLHTGSISIPSGVTRIGSYAFYRGRMTELVIPEGVTEIGKSAFYGADGLTSVSLPQSLTRIGERAFNYCSSLVDVVIVKGVAEIGESAFGYCTSLATVKYTGSEEEWNAINKNPYWNNGSTVTVVYNYTAA